MLIEQRQTGMRLEKTARELFACDDIELADERVFAIENRDIRKPSGIEPSPVLVIEAADIMNVKPQKHAPGMTERAALKVFAVLALVIEQKGTTECREFRKKLFLKLWRKRMIDGVEIPVGCMLREHFRELRRGFEALDIANNRHAQPLRGREDDRLFWRRENDRDIGTDEHAERFVIEVAAQIENDIVVLCAFAQVREECIEDIGRWRNRDGIEQFERSLGDFELERRLGRDWRKVEKRRALTTGR